MFASSQTLFHLINKNTGVAVNTTFYGDGFIFFHHINAYEEDGHVVFDLIAYKDSSVYDLFYIDSMKLETQKFTEMSKVFSPPVCKRFVIPVNADLKVSVIRNVMANLLINLVKVVLYIGITGIFVGHEPSELRGHISYSSVAERWFLVLHSRNTD